ncbi:taxadiene 5-alpha hydroxylase-like [Lolium rigidum]|uniref:taxadiene 5-alpha hydroxylase-like n=1 Tax=Lolium rigidum TaxID=89674 RepID=UPI001F5DD954|nr:taxadiene 5-alpha hydroxylase-like [Lolium rigidum]
MRALYLERTRTKLYSRFVGDRTTAFPSEHRNLRATIVGPDIGLISTREPKLHSQNTCSSMDYLLEVVALVLTASAIAIQLIMRRARKPCPANLPPGTLGVPMIGQTLGIIRAARANGGNQWIRDRMDMYGPIFKASVLCTPTVFLTGPTANKLIFFSSSMLRGSTPLSLKRIFGERTILDLHGDDHRRVRGALMELLKPAMLRQYIGRIDANVRQHLEEKWYGQTTITVLPLMRRLTLDIISALLFGLETSAMRDALNDDFGHMIEGVFAFPVDLPFTTFGRSLKAGRRARRVLEGIIRDKKSKLGHGKASPNNDIITRLLTLTDHHGEQLLTEEEIVDNGILALISGNDTTSVLITFMVQHLANHPATLAAMVQEHEEIARSKAHQEALTWEDLSKMKFTWQVAQETLRIDPPIFGNFRTAHEDIEFDGYCIPKGWKVFWSANVTHMDPSIFPEPHKFDPSRFASQSSVTPPCSFVGHRICVGIELAKIQTLVMMHNLVRHFTWKLRNKENSFLREHGLPIELQQKTPFSMRPH